MSYIIEIFRVDKNGRPVESVGYYKQLKDGRVVLVDQYDHARIFRNQRLAIHRLNNLTKFHRKNQFHFQLHERM